MSKHYNIQPLLNMLSRDVPNRDLWSARIISFFMNETYDPFILDEYYDTLIRNPFEVGYLTSKGFYVDQYTGLFSFSTMETDNRHTFNMAYYIKRYYHDFINKNVLTLTADYGIMNLQLKFIGINVVNSIIPKNLKLGAMLACIGNNGNPYPINLEKFKKYDVIIAANVFDTNEEAYENWDFLLSERLKGKEVYLTSHSNTNLINHMNYDRVELAEDPIHIYDNEDYANLSAGYTNKIYKLK